MAAPSADVAIDVLVDVKPLLGEGPLWDVATERLWFIDSLGDRIHRCTADGRELRTWEVPGHVGAMALAGDGRALLALVDGFHLMDLATHESEHLVDPEPGRDTNRLNDGKVDRRGRFVCGSMDMAEERDSGTLWSLGPDRVPRELDRNIICSNGPCFSPDGTTLYFADSFKGVVYAYDYDGDTGGVSNRRTFAEPAVRPGGAPDGATVDAEGGVWIALVFDGRILRYAPDGTLDRTVEMPVVKTTSVAFGGPELDTLYVTSMARPPLPRYPGDGPLRGSTFAVTGLGVRGLPERRWAG